VALSEEKTRKTGWFGGETDTSKVCGENKRNRLPYKTHPNNKNHKMERTLKRSNESSAGFGGGGIRMGRWSEFLNKGRPVVFREGSSPDLWMGRNGIYQASQYRKLSSAGQESATKKNHGFGGYAKAWEINWVVSK